MIMNWKCLHQEGQLCNRMVLYILLHEKKKKKKEKGSLFKMKEIAVIITGKSGVLDNLPVSDVLRIS